MFISRYRHNLLLRAAEATARTGARDLSQLFRDTFERALTVLREENSLLQKLLAASIEREQEARSDAMALSAATAFPAPSPEAPVPRLDRPPVMRAREGGTPWEELPAGDPRGTYKPGEDDILTPQEQERLLDALKGEDAA
jgi:hypothetical protein